MATQAKDIAVRDEQPTDYAGGLLSVIERAARDPNVDIDKMERLIAVHERIHSRNAEAEFNEAMALAQAEMRPVAADASNPQTKSKYASYAKLDRAIRPIYTNHGFSLSFDEGETDKPDYVRVLCYVSHTGGFSRTYKRDMPADGKGAKGGDVMTKTHAVGAAGSYGARYLLKGIFNIAVGDDDRDGNGAGDYEMISADQCAELRRLIASAKTDEVAFCKRIGVGTLPELAAENFERAKGILVRRIEANNQGGGNGN